MTKKTFTSVKGSGSADKMDSYKIDNGNNAVRLFGNILPRYVYWVKGTNNKNLPFECLEFNRDSESFDKAEKDWVKVFFPDLKCSWAYSMLCIHNGEVKIFNFKKKLFEQIMSNVEDLGDPTDPETGWVLHFEKKKTGPLPINVEYTLQPIKCQNSKGPLSEADAALIAASKPIEEILARPTPDAQKEVLEKILKGESDNIDEAVEEELTAE